MGSSHGDSSTYVPTLKNQLNLDVDIDAHHRLAPRASRDHV